MKYLKFVLAVILVGNLSSCKKAYDCKCDFAEDGATGTYTVEENFRTKQQAKDWCSNLGENANDYSNCLLLN